jgi:hypothetical protein
MPPVKASNFVDMQFAASRPPGAAFFTAVENSGIVIGFAARRAIVRRRQ